MALNNFEHEVQLYFVFLFSTYCIQMKKIFRKIGLAILIIFILIQFIPTERPNPDSDPNLSLFSVVSAPNKMEAMIKTSCYDCHSNNTDYPWYSGFSPVSWFVIHHVKDARKHLNFSSWGEYDLKKQRKKIEEIVEKVHENEMPLKSYLIMHREAKLSNEQRNEITSWFEELESSMN